MHFSCTAIFEAAQLRESSIASNQDPTDFLRPQPFAFSQVVTPQSRKIHAESEGIRLHSLQDTCH
ncbi:hypothetical protein NITLEN_50054 [Nitrospira lenta]|uniref:Uncharacterized protein n=1 Tax=Nitrospira lenta TaxID=1436998 RepID=A0A330L8H3_9BACT|nr:hypothetical protein NITLEN_50054 [Nitrospira lenta]